MKKRKISRRQFMEMYDCSKATALKLERQGKLTPYTFTGDRRKIYYDLKEIESIFEPIDSNNHV